MVFVAGNHNIAGLVAWPRHVLNGANDTDDIGRWLHLTKSIAVPVPQRRRTCRISFPITQAGFSVNFHRCRVGRNQLGPRSWMDHFLQISMQISFGSSSCRL